MRCFVETILLLEEGVAVKMCHCTEEVE
jgi:hypothetical protein